MKTSDNSFGNLGCIGQWSLEPEEHPTQRVTSLLAFVPPRDTSRRFGRFSILKEDSFNDK